MRFYWLTRSRCKAKCASCGKSIDAYSFRFVFELPKESAGPISGIGKWGRGRWPGSFWRYVHLDRSCLKHHMLAPPLPMEGEAPTDVCPFPKKSGGPSEFRKAKTEEAMVILQAEFAVARAVGASSS